MNNERGFWINDQMVFVIRVFQVSIQRNLAHEFTLSFSGCDCRRYLYGNIFCISLVDDIFQRDNQCFVREVRGNTVVPIRDGYEPDFEKRKNLFQIVSCFQIVSTQTGKVFYHDTVNQSRLHILHHFIKRRTFKLRSGITVINVHLIKMQIVVVIDERHQKILLVLQAISIELSAVLHRKSNIRSSPKSLNRFIWYCRCDNAFCAQHGSCV